MRHALARDGEHPGGSVEPIDVGSPSGGEREEETCAAADVEQRRARPGVEPLENGVEERPRRRLLHLGPVESAGAPELAVLLRSPRGRHGAELT